eukprot:TRINITY_DN2785_c0_g3_i2.p1 TRINITY_DN2785_c0_g3~~TRINITY_DN2785_c0_g3_i2.p1  ORF type:complete len:230 (-),score=50.80 TRINITY_DN2785_c0_g3_i2:367-1056(-)
MKKTEYTGSLSNTAARRFTYNTPMAKSSIRSPRDSAENKMFDYIEKEVSSTLTALHNERMKQSSAIDKVKKELKNLAVLATPSVSKRDPLSKDDTFVKNKYEAYIKAQENQLKRLEKELVYAKEDLKIKEEQLKLATIANEKLSEQMNLLKQQTSQNDYIKSIQANLLRIVNGKERYVDPKLLQSKDQGINELLLSIESLIKTLVKENTKLIENKRQFPIYHHTHKPEA